jgi:hypothetical protein
MINKLENVDELLSAESFFFVLNEKMNEKMNEK